MRAWIQTSRFDQSHFGEQEFPHPLQVGMSIFVTDKNANPHFLRMLSIRQKGWNPKSEVADFLEHGAKSFGIVLQCETDTNWLDEIREAAKSAREN
jgi:hypothetical protein